MQSVIYNLIAISDPLNSMITAFHNTRALPMPYLNKLFIVKSLYDL